MDVVRSRRACFSKEYTGISARLLQSKTTHQNTAPETAHGAEYSPGFEVTESLY